MKYFKIKELVCPCCGEYNTTVRLESMLDMLRSKLGKPIKINSGTRCDEHNRKVGGSDTSSHVKGMAVDIHIPNDEYREELIWYAGQVGFTRIGIGSNFIHLDCDDSKRNALWRY